MVSSLIWDDDFRRLNARGELANGLDLRFDF
jgi:hypothetical protein